MMSDKSGNQEISSNASPQLKLYQAFIFSLPILFTFVLLLLFYVFYLRRRSFDWSALRMRSSPPLQAFHQAQDHHNISRCELGLKKELREMLPVIVYKASFSVQDTQCSVCLVDYQADDRLQQIPACRHVFHMDCIDHWLNAHTTCPLCRQCLLASAKSSSQAPDIQLETNIRSSSDQSDNETSLQNGLQSCEGAQSSQERCDLGRRDEAIIQLSREEEERESQLADIDREMCNFKSDTARYKS